MGGGTLMGDGGGGDKNPLRQKKLDPLSGLGSLSRVFLDPRCRSRRRTKIEPEPLRKRNREAEPPLLYRLLENKA